MTITTDTLAQFERLFDQHIRIFDDRTIIAIKQAINNKRRELTKPEQKKRTLL